MSIKKNDVKNDAQQKRTAIYSSSELQSGWAADIGKRTTGWWVDSDDNVASKYRLDKDQAPITSDYFTEIQKKIDNGTFPKNYLLGEVYVLSFSHDSKPFVVYMDENEENIIMFSMSDIDFLSWDAYNKDGLRYFKNVIGAGCQLESLVRNPTFKTLSELRILEIMIKKWGEKKHFSINMNTPEASTSKEA